MQGRHPAQDAPDPDCAYAFLLDFGGPAQSTSPSEADGRGEGLPPSPSQGEGRGEGGLPSRLQRRSRSRDATALTIVAIDEDDTVSLPVYRVVHRRIWTGTDHRTLYGQLLALAETWNPVAIVADATGIASGPANHTHSHRIASLLVVSCSQASTYKKTAPPPELSDYGLISSMETALSFLPGSVLFSA